MNNNDKMKANAAQKAAFFHFSNMKTKVFKEPIL